MEEVMIAMGNDVRDLVRDVADDRMCYAIQSVFTEGALNIVRSELLDIADDATSRPLVAAQAVFELLVREEP